jgi:hypothetical protein
MRVKDNTGMAVPLLKTGKTVLRTRRHRELWLVKSVYFFDLPPKAEGLRKLD